ncbi:hypothetical protein FWG95_02645 [Candidatus Saccharibacteria bacterium]|nr:hypothetical protein [Candidatus Saccharibacteria bacterium]
MSREFTVAHFVERQPVGISFEGFLPPHMAIVSTQADRRSELDILRGAAGSFPPMKLQTSGKIDYYRPDITSLGRRVYLTPELQDLRSAMFTRIARSGLPVDGTEIFNPHIAATIGEMPPPGKVLVVKDLSLVETDGDGLNIVVDRLPLSGGKSHRMRMARRLSEMLQRLRK